MNLPMFIGRGIQCVLEPLVPWFFFISLDCNYAKALPLAETGVSSIGKVGLAAGSSPTPNDLLG